MFSSSFILFFRFLLFIELRNNNNKKKLNEIATKQLIIQKHNLIWLPTTLIKNANESFLKQIIPIGAMVSMC